MSAPFTWIWLKKVRQAVIGCRHALHRRDLVQKRVAFFILRSSCYSLDSLPICRAVIKCCTPYHRSTTMSKRTTTLDIGDIPSTSDRARRCRQSSGWASQFTSLWSLSKWPVSCSPSSETWMPASNTDGRWKRRWSATPCPWATAYSSSLTKTWTSRSCTVWWWRRGWSTAPATHHDLIDLSNVPLWQIFSARTFRGWQRIIWHLYWMPKNHPSFVYTLHAWCWHTCYPTTYCARYQLHQDLSEQDNGRYMHHVQRAMIWFRCH